MRPSPRNKYFGWLLLLIFLIYALIFLVFFSIELHESHVQNTPFSEEYPEFVAILLVMLFTVPAGLYVAWAIAGKLLQPLNQVLATAKHISDGNLDERIPPLPYPDELAKLAETINDAFDRYAGAVERLENFSADASHQLRTPLAAIRTSAEVTLQSERALEDYKEAIGAILEQTEKLNQTIEQLLKLSRLDATLRSGFTNVHLAREIKNWTNEVSAFIEDKTFNVTVEDQAENIIIKGNPLLLKEVFSNLLNNALAVTSANGTIDIHVSNQRPGFIEWRMEDSGPGIPAEERDRIFDRFYRGKKAGYSGSGLGLAIVRQIVHLHGGTIHAESATSLGGAALCINLPVS